MSAKRYVARDSHVAARVLGGEMMIMSGAKSTLFTLNPVATAIWEAADGATPLDEIVLNRVCKEFDVTPEVAMKDAEALVNDLVEHGIMISSDQPIHQGTMAAQAK